MNHSRVLNSRYETVAWGSVLVLLGSFGLIPGDQAGIAVLGIGIVLTGLNLARTISKLPANVFSMVLGILATTAGLVVLLRPASNIPHFELDLFPLALLVIGLYLLLPGPRRRESR